jgi:hypothetical protein
MVGVAAAGERREAVAIDQRQVRELGDVASQGRQVRGVIGQGLVQGVIGQRPAAGGAIDGAVPPHQRPGLPLDAVDPEHEIQDRTHQRRQPDDADPADGAARVALGEDDVAGGHDGDDRVDQADHPRPDRRQKPRQLFGHATIVAAARAERQGRGPAGYGNFKLRLSLPPAGIFCVPLNVTGASD